MENDVYAGSQINTYLDQEDLAEYGLLRQIIGRWFAFELERYVNQKEYTGSAELRVKPHINLICPDGRNDICPEFAGKIGFHEAERNIINLIFQDYDLKVRGKQLFQMLSRYTSKKGRFSKLNENNLIDIALRQGGNQYINDLVGKINSKLVA